MIRELTREEIRDDLVLSLFERLRTRINCVSDADLRAAIIDEVDAYLSTVDEDEFFVDPCRWDQVADTSLDLIDDMENEAQTTTKGKQ